MATITYQTLSEEVKQNIRWKKYSLEELTQLHELVKTQYAEKKVGFRRLLIVFTIIMVFMVVMTYMSMSKMPNVNMTVMAGTMGVMVVACLLVLMFLKSLMVDKVRNQFISLIKHYYPQYVTQFGKDTFK